MRTLKQLLAFLLVLCTMLSFVACDHEFDNNEEGGDNNITVIPTEAYYNVKIVTPDGLGVSDVTVYIHKSDAEFDVAGLPLTTNKNGNATVKLPILDTYSAQITGLHERYLLPEADGPHGRYNFSGANAVITVDYNPDYTPEVYTVGDKVADFTITDVYGNTHTLSELLEEKRMVMLNFWFTACGPCASEFPAINAAYNKYKDNMEILAISDYPLDSEEKLKAYPASEGFVLDFPLIYSKNFLNPESFGSKYYPTTVIIDRYGVICMIEIGAIPYEEIWNNTFAYFTADDYQERIFLESKEIPTK